MIHYHGLPITPASVRWEMAGRCFCVRYGEHRTDDKWAHTHGQAVMLDNGAFPAWTRESDVDWPGYYEWCERWLDYKTTWAVIPDVIDGTEEQNDRMLVEWFQVRLPRGAPVWHMHESLDRLARLCHGYERVCLGSSGQYAEIGTRSWHFRMEQAMNRIHREETWLHGLRMMSMAGSLYPLSSADSTNIARNHAGNNSGRPRKDVVRMANELDASQCPARWTPREQLALRNG